MAEITSTTGFLDVQGAPLYYEVAGQGPALLLIHAGVGDLRMWDLQFETFARHYQTIRFDMRSFGKSLVPDQPFANHEDPAALLQHLGIRKAHVIGASFGGSVAIDFALTHPDMVASLILVAPDMGGYAPSEEIKEFGKAEGALVESGDLEAATELNLRMWVDGPLRKPEQVDPLVRQKVHDMQYQAFTALVPENAEDIELDPPAAERLAELQIPTLVFVGDHDVPQKLTLAQDLTSQVAGAQQVIVSGAAHMLSMEQPELFISTVLEFLNKQ